MLSMPLSRDSFTRLTSLTGWKLSISGCQTKASAAPKSCLRALPGESRSSAVAIRSKMPERGS
jgi:hypothetical protein